MHIVLEIRDKKEECSMNIRVDSNQKIYDYIKITIVLSVITVILQILLKVIGFISFSKYHIILSIILLFAGIHLLTDDRPRKKDLYYFAVTFVNDLIIICPVFFELGRFVVRNI